MACRQSIEVAIVEVLHGDRSVGDDPERRTQLGTRSSADGQHDMVRLDRRWIRQPEAHPRVAIADGGDRRSRHKVDADVLEPAGDQLADGRAEATLLGTILVADQWSRRCRGRRGRLLPRSPRSRTR